MELIKDAEFGGERPLFASQDIKLENVTIHAGESALKECSNVEVENCVLKVSIHFGMSTDLR